MILDIIKRFNWVDILVITLLFRVCYIATKNGLGVGIFKLLGTLTAIYFSLHYYTNLSDWFVQRTPVGEERMPLEFMDFLSFIILAMIGYLIFVSIRIVFYRFLKMEAIPKLNFWGGFVLGAGRGILLAGLVIFMLVISSISYLKSSVADSYSGGYLLKVTPATYGLLWNGFVSKFMTAEKFNQTALEVQKDFIKQ